MTLPESADVRIFNAMKRADVMIVTRSEQRGGWWTVTRRALHPFRNGRRDRFYTLQGVQAAILAWAGPIKVRVAKPKGTK